MDNKWIGIRNVTRWCLGLALILTGFTANAEGRLYKVATRPDVKTTLFWQAQEGAVATVLLFPGGAGGFGKVEDGKAMGGNFLVRSAPYFLANGFNVAIFGRPNDMELGWTDRTEETHMTDIRAILDFVKRQSQAPIWIIGTSRGTVSATAAAINIQDPAIAGLVLTASIVKYDTPGTVVRQDLAAIKVPTLVYHHAKDGCKHCQAHEVPAILRRLKNAPFKKEIMVSGGANPTGDPCAGQHWHGFIGMEKEAVDTIADWIKQPSS